jgi:hypothetical protein
MNLSFVTNECDIIAILTPSFGKIDRVMELLSALTEAVREKEPGVISFHFYKDFDRESGNEELVLVERYVYPPRTHVLTFSFYIRSLPSDYSDLLSKH